MNSQKRYSLFATFYDVIILRLLGHEFAADYLIKQLPFNVNDTLMVLDAGTGTGLYSLAILKRFPNARIEAFDLSERMLSKFRRKIEKRGLSARIDIFNGDVLSFLAQHKQFDLVITAGVLEHVNLDKAVRNLSQYVKSGGYFFNAGVKNNVIGSFIGSFWDIHIFAKETVVRAFSDQGLSLIAFLELPRRYFFMRLAKATFLFKKS